MEQDKQIRLGHGSGGKMTHDLITELFLKHFDNGILKQQSDAALIPGTGDIWAISTDSFVVDPLFFPGGNIGSLAISGTVNDLAVSGAVPRYLSAAFILEEGFSKVALEEIVITMAATARDAGVRIIAGDTKVVNKGQCDKLFITTTGVGSVIKALEHISGGLKVTKGDQIIVNGYFGDHGVAILGERESLKFSTPVTSDAACLNGMIAEITKQFDVHFMRDATRGGLATVLAELAVSRKLGITVDETVIPVREEVKGICEVFGYDPLYMANEGKVVMVVPENNSERVLEKLRQHPLGKNSAIIGSISGESDAKVRMHTEIGGSRFLDMLASEQLPRIC